MIIIIQLADLDSLEIEMTGEDIEEEEITEAVIDVIEIEIEIIVKKNKAGAAVTEAEAVIREKNITAEKEKVDPQGVTDDHHQNKIN